MPKGACSPNVSSAVNGAMVEVSGKTQHSGLGGSAWEQGPDVFNFDGGRRGKAGKQLHRITAFLVA